MKYIVIICIKMCNVILNIIYFFMKLFPTQNKVIFVSRQSNSLNIDFQLLINRIREVDENIKINVFCKTIDKGFLGKIKYGIYIIKVMYHLATSKVCITDTYSIPISVLKHKKNLEIIQIWHALGALKKFGYQCLDTQEGRSSVIAKAMKMHKNYSHIMCASSETKKLYAEAFNAKEENILVLGMPRIDYILSQDNSDKILEKHPEFSNKKTILYIPTFRKDSEAKDEEFEDFIDFNKYNLIIKAHPLEKSEAYKKYEIDESFNTYDLIKFADYVITDYSAVSFEAGVLDKQIYFYVYDIEQYQKTRGLNIDLLEEMSNITSKNMKAIIEKIESEDYDYEQLRRFNEKYVETKDTNNTERIVDFIFNYLESTRNEENKEVVSESIKEKSNV